MSSLTMISDCSREHVQHHSKPFLEEDALVLLIHVPSEHSGSSLSFALGAHHSGFIIALSEEVIR